MLCKGSPIPEKSKKISLYNHFSLVRENHHRGEYHTSSYKEGSLFIDQFKATQKGHTGMVRTRVDSRQKTVALASI